MNTANETQKTGLVGTMVSDNDTELVGSRVARINPTVVDQSGAAIDDDDDDLVDIDDDDLEMEPYDEDGDPTGEHDHHQDDNFALGGKVTRSGS